MAQRFDTIIIGGGAIGCSVAYHLAKKGIKPIVVDKRAMGAQASSMPSGMLAAQEESFAPDAFFDLCMAGRELVQTMAPEIKFKTGIDPELEITGIWHAAEREKDKNTLLEKMQWQKDKGLPVEWHEQQHLRDVLPGLQPCQGALYYPKDGHLNTVKWVKGLAEAARMCGARFMDHVPDFSLIKEDNEVTGIKTRKEIYFADKTIITAGVWTSKVFGELGITLQQKPIRGQLMVLGGIPRAFQGPVYAGQGYLVPKPDGRLVIGATMEDVGFDTHPTMSAQRYLADWVTRWCVGIHSLPVLEFPVGLRPFPPDSWPVMGPVKDYEGLYVCTGHFRNGILLSAISGQYMADGMAEGTWAPLGQAFSPDRFMKETAAQETETEEPRPKTEDHRPKINGMGRYL